MVRAYEIGITEAQFLDLSPRFFALLVARDWERQEQQYRNGWEQIRWQTAALLAPYSKRQMRPTDLIRFPWEAAETPTLILPENYKSLSAAMDKAAQKEGIIS